MEIRQDDNERIKNRWGRMVGDADMTDSETDGTDDVYVETPFMASHDAVCMNHEIYFHEALKEARQATCERRKCGSVVVSAECEVIGRGWNGPPAHDECQRRCDRKAELHAEFKSDKTCCVHAEWRAIFDALRNAPEKVVGSTLYFAACDKNGEHVFVGEPYCTICSKIALDVGVKWFGLWHQSGICLYDTREYNDLSFAWKP